MPRTRQSFEEELRRLEDQLLKMGAFVEAMLERAMRSLVEQDLTLAREVIASDDIADDMDLEIEQDCMRLLALQQPMSRDLRTISTALKVIHDVERIGDYSVDIAKIAVDLAHVQYSDLLGDIPEMGVLARAVVRESLEALIKRDLDLVRKVGEDDTAVDYIWRAVRNELIATMQARSDAVPQAVMLLLVARYLERAADHAVNVAERVVYMETGHLQQLVRSHSPKYEPDERRG